MRGSVPWLPGGDIAETRAHAALGGVDPVEMVRTFVQLRTLSQSIDPGLAVRARGREILA